MADAVRRDVAFQEVMRERFATRRVLVAGLASEKTVNPAASNQPTNIVAYMVFIVFEESC